MGFSPVDVDRMTIWQFQAALNGYMKAHGLKNASSGDIPDEVLRQMGIEGF